MSDLISVDSIISHFEKDVSDFLAETVGGKREVRCQHGIADVVTNDVVWEVKYIKMYKHAVGQALLYADCLNLRPAIYLFYFQESELTSLRDIINGWCNRNNVAVGYKHVEDDRKSTKTKSMNECDNIQSVKINDNHSVRVVTKNGKTMICLPDILKCLGSKSNCTVMLASIKQTEKTIFLVKNIPINFISEPAACAVVFRSRSKKADNMRDTLTRVLRLGHFKDSVFEQKDNTNTTTNTDNGDAFDEEKEIEQPEKDEIRPSKNPVKFNDKNLTMLNRMVPAIMSMEMNDKWIAAQTEIRLAEIASMDRQRELDVELKERMKRIEVEVADRAIDRDVAFQKRVECIRRENAARLHNEKLLEHWKELSRWIFRHHSVPNGAYNELRHHLQHVENHMMRSRDANAETDDMTRPLNPQYSPPTEEFWLTYPERHTKNN